RLKTGGPAMNVTGTNDFSQEVFCEWFAGDHLQRGQFHFTSVEPASAPTSKSETVNPENTASDVTDPSKPPARESRVGYLLGGIAILILTAFLFFHDLAGSKPIGPNIALSLISLVGGVGLIIWSASSHDVRPMNARTVIDN